MSLNTDEAAALASLERAEAYSRKRIDQFIATLNERPGHAFEWGTNEMRHAAAIDAIWAIRHCIKSYGMDAAIKMSTKHALDAARYPPSSTAALSNLTEIFRASAYAAFAQDGML